MCQVSEAVGRSCCGHSHTMAPSFRWNVECQDDSADIGLKVDASVLETYYNEITYSRCHCAQDNDLLRKLGNAFRTRPHLIVDRLQV